MSSPSLQKKKALFLYFEIAGYVVACLERLAAKYAVEIHLVRYPVNAIAPFNITLSKSIHTYERKNYSEEQLLELTHSINPDFVFVNGWSDKGYMYVCKDLKKKIPVVLTFDNPWLGTIKQRIATMAGPVYLKRLFTHCWVPGEPNAVYARKLGFRKNQLYKGMYSADVPLFHGYFKQNEEAKKKSFPHRFIFVGRYTELKGFNELVRAFLSLSEDEIKDWELWCFGKGELESLIANQPRIRNCGFVQPSELAPYLSQTGVFVLPAHYEHWGVVVHEFAAAGFPLVCSHSTSAATTFLKEGINGYFTKAKSTDSIRNVLKKIIQHPNEELLAMGEQSVRLSDQITPDTWSDTAWELINKQHNVRN
jgi:glycosyltransferase involved in cell wall biosynthesis